MIASDSITCPSSGWQKQRRSPSNCLAANKFEVMSLLDTSSLVIGMERPVSCCDFPSVVSSDNGTKILEIKDELSQNIFNWNQILVDSVVKKGTLL